MSTPPGVKGKHWEQKTIKVTSGKSVRVTATATTVNAQSGNSTRIVLNVNDVKVADHGEQDADASVSYDIHQNGTYRLEAIAYNDRADAHRCTISAETIDIEEF